MQFYLKFCDYFPKISKYNRIYLNTVFPKHLKIVSLSAGRPLPRRYKISRAEEIWTSGVNIFDEWEEFKHSAVNATRVLFRASIFRSHWNRYLTASKGLQTRSSFVSCNQQPLSLSTHTPLLLERSPADFIASHVPFPSHREPPKLASLSSLKERDAETGVWNIPASCLWWSFSLLPGLHLSWTACI